MATASTFAMEVGPYIELVKAIGFPGVIFLIWYLYHRSENQKWEKNFKAQQEMIGNMLKENSKRAEDQFHLWKEMSESLMMQVTQISRMDTKISTNQYCPILRGDVKP